MFTSLKRIIRSGWLAFRRQAGLSAATIFILVMTTSLVTSLFLFQKATQFMISQLQEKVDISVYFKNDALEQDILKIKDEISKIPEVKNVEYVSHQEGLKRLLERHPEFKESVEETEGLLNLASLNIKANQSSQYAAISNFLENAPFKNLIEKIDYYQRKPIIERVFSLSSTINRSGIIFSIILAIVAFLVAFNQVKFAIFNSREEIAIQRLVGASNWFIRGPFLVQGVISGFFAILITLFIFFPLLFFFGPKVEILFPGLNLFEIFTTNFFLILLFQFFTGIGLGVVSSLIAIRKYLKI
jgi:cell division transport system permease protein